MKRVRDKEWKWEGEIKRESIERVVIIICIRGERERIYNEIDEERFRESDYMGKEGKDRERKWKRER